MSPKKKKVGKVFTLTGMYTIAFTNAVVVCIVVVSLLILSLVLSEDQFQLLLEMFAK